MTGHCSPQAPQGVRTIASDLRRHQLEAPHGGAQRYRRGAPDAGRRNEVTETRSGEIIRPQRRPKSFPGE